MNTKLDAIRERDRRDHHGMELSGGQSTAAYRDDGHGGWRDAHYDRRYLLTAYDEQAREIERLRERVEQLTDVLDRRGIDLSEGGENE